MGQERASRADIEQRARDIAAAGGLAAAIDTGALPEFIETSVSESVILGLMRQGVTKFLGILGHGSTDIGEVLRIYSEAGLVRFFQCRNEVAMAHAATALRWVYGETAAILTSIGPGALQAMAGSLAAAANGVGVYHLYGDETTFGEGYNLQQIPNRKQGQFGRLLDVMGSAYTLHTPGALREALRRGTGTVHAPYFAGPFFLALPINVQPKYHRYRLESLPTRLTVARVAPADDAPYEEASSLIARHRRIVIKAGAGAARFGKEILALAEAAGAVVVLSPGSVGMIADSHARNMHVGGTKGSISGNYAMEQAELVIVVGSRAVCQADCSGTGYPSAQAVININGRLEDAAHYNRTVALNGDIDVTIGRLVQKLETKSIHATDWLAACAAKKKEWSAYKSLRVGNVRLRDPVWNREVLTQPSAIAAVARFAKDIAALKVFDAGDVQANGFQIVEDDEPGESVTEAGASYMGFAACALLASALADSPRYMIGFTGDGSFIMNPQILVDAAVHGVRGMIVIFDNRRMGAISSLQDVQYGSDFATNDNAEIDFVAMAESVRGVAGFFGGYSTAELDAALRQAHAHAGLSIVHVPVYWGSDPLGGMGAYGRWNVGPWVEDAQSIYAAQRI